MRSLVMLALAAVCVGCTFVLIQTNANPFCLFNCKADAKPAQEGKP